MYLGNVKKFHVATKWKVVIIFHKPTLSRKMESAYCITTPNFHEAKLIKE